MKVKVLVTQLCPTLCDPMVGTDFFFSSLWLEREGEKIQNYFASQWMRRFLYPGEPDEGQDPFWP